MPEINQKALLQRFEPVLRFMHGERFLPYNVDDYVAEASLWVKEHNKPPEEIISESELDLSDLGSIRLEGVRRVYYLQFISPVNLAEMAELKIKELRESVKTRKFKPARSRLARVGYLARLVDAAFSLALLLRGRVPGDSKTAAEITFERMLSNKRSFKYYGRVVQQSGWTILQYWYFYPFNDWRSSFYGANDHEADWEMVNIYCYQDSDKVTKPAWVAYACHNYSGDDLRRHWDDPELEKVGEHPVVYVGGGSHASYFQQGEYLTQLSLPFLKPYRNVISVIDKLLRKLFRENNTAEGDESEKSQLFTIPFVDYALGDGFSIGPGCDQVWDTPGLIEPAPDWVVNFRGLWGFYAKDPFSGEDAPAGPRYNRDGSVRHAWFDPLGWAGMEKVVSPIEKEAIFEVRKAGIRSEIMSLNKEIKWLQDVHYQRGIDFAAIRDVSYLQKEALAIRELLEEERMLLAEKRHRLTIETAMLEAMERHSESVLRENQLSIRAHIKRPHQPQSKKDLRFSGLAEVWAAVSIGMMMMAVVLLIVFARQFLLVGLSGLLLVMITFEAAFRRKLAGLVRWIAVALAFVGVLIFLFEFLWFFLLALVMVVGFYMIVENLRELFARK